MRSDEMRMYLRSGPCCEELIEPIIQWIYYGNDINRCHFEEYMEVFQILSLEIQSMNLRHKGDLDPGILASLHSKYGVNRSFTCSNVSAVFRKLPQSRTIGSFIFKWCVHLRKRFNNFTFKLYAQLLERFPETKWLVKLKPLHRLKGHILGS